MVVLSIALALLAASSGTPAETAWRACVDRTTTNTEWAQCGGSYIRQADAALNAEWKRLMAKASGQTKTDLVAEQRTWLAYRQHACHFYDNGDWGRVGQVLHFPGCVAGAIERRTAELAAYREFITQE